MRVILGMFAFALFLACTVCVAEVVEHFPCDQDASSNSTCVVHEVRIDPCAEASEKQPCKIKRGRSAIIAFDYTSGFDADNVLGQVYWVSGEGDLPFVGMNTAACQHTTCPLKAPTRQTYTYNFQTAKKFPARIYEIKWTLADPTKSSGECCFRTKIRLTK